MRRIFLLAVAIGGAWLSGAPAYGESCSPAMCAGMSPACWNAYQKAIVAKDDKIGSVDKCRAPAEEGLEIQRCGLEGQQELRPQFLQGTLLARPHASGAQHEAADRPGRRGARGARRHRAVGRVGRLGIRVAGH